MSGKEKSGHFEEDKMNMPNAETREAMDEVERREGMIHSGEEYMVKLGRLLEERKKGKEQ